MKKIVSFIILFYLHSAAYGCICSNNPFDQTTLTGWETSDVIFLGKVSKIIDDSKVYDNDGQQQKFANFEIIEGFKNISYNQKIITLDYSDNSCSVTFEEGKIYVVYGHRIASGIVFTNQCTKTREIIRDWRKAKEIHELQIISKEKDVKQPKLESFIMVEKLTLETIKNGNNQNKQSEETVRTLHWCLGLSMAFNLIMIFIIIRKRGSAHG